MLLGKNKGNEYALNLGSSDYFMFLDAGLRNDKTSSVISLKSYQSNSAIPLYQNSVWPRSEVAEEIPLADATMLSNWPRSEVAEETPLADATMVSNWPRSEVAEEIPLADATMVSNWPRSEVAEETPLADATMVSNWPRSEVAEETPLADATMVSPHISLDTKIANDSRVSPKISLDPQISGDSRLSTNIPLNTHVADDSWPFSELPPALQFVTFCNIEISEEQKHHISGRYLYNAAEKKVTFDLKLKVDKAEERKSGSIQMIALGISEDDNWGNDLLITCDTQPHISAFGLQKVHVFYV